MHEIIRDAIDTKAYAFSPPDAISDKHELLLAEFKRFLRVFVCKTDEEYAQLVDWYRTTLRSLSTGMRNDAILVLNTENDIRRIVYHVFSFIIGDPLARVDWHNDCIEPKDYCMYIPTVYVDIDREPWTKHRLDTLLSIQRSHETITSFKYRKWQYTSPVRANICISSTDKRDNLRMFKRDGFIICNGHPGGKCLNRSKLFLKMEDLANDIWRNEELDKFKIDDTKILLEAVSYWLLNTDSY